MYVAHNFYNVANKDFKEQSKIIQAKKEVVWPTVKYYTASYVYNLVHKQMY